MDNTTENEPCGRRRYNASGPLIWDQMVKKSSVGKEKEHSSKKYGIWNRHPLLLKAHPIASAGYFSVLVRKKKKLIGPHGEIENDGRRQVTDEHDKDSVLLYPDPLCLNKILIFVYYTYKA